MCVKSLCLQGRFHVVYIHYLSVLDGKTSMSARIPHFWVTRIQLDLPQQPMPKGTHNKHHLVECIMLDKEGGRHFTKHDLSAKIYSIDRHVCIIGLEGRLKDVLYINLALKPKVLKSVQKQSNTELRKLKALGINRVKVQSYACLFREKPSELSGTRW